MTPEPTASELRYKVDVVQADNSSDDGYGEPGQVTVIAKMCANVEDLAGIELVRAQLIADKTSHRVTCRYDTRLQPNMRIAFGHRTFRIASILDIGRVRNVWLHLLCVEIASR